MKKETMLVVIGDEPAPVTPLRAAVSAPEATRGKAYAGQVTGIDGAGGYVYSITAGALPAGLALDAATGAIDGTPTTQGYEELTIRATDALGATDDVVVAIFTGGGIALMKPDLPDAEHDIAYNANLFASGGTPPYTWTVESGSLPTGMSIVGDTIDGVGDNASNFSAVYTFVLRATDANGNYSEAEYTILVWPPVFVSTIKSDVPFETFVGANYLGQVGGRHGVSDVGFGAGGVLGGPAIAYSLDNAPPGIVINASTGALSGIPTTPGDYAMDTNVTDALGGSGTNNFAIRVFASSPTKRHTESIGDGVATDITITHNFGSDPFAITVYDAASGLKLADVPIEAADSNSFVVSFKDPPAPGSVLVQVLG